jgi:hypothetical protein
LSSFLTNAVYWFKVENLKMDFIPSSLSLRAAGALAAVATALAFSASAQQSGEPIIFSKPADDGLGAGPQVSPDSMPQAFDNSTPDFSSSPDMPMPMPQLNSAWQKTLNDRRNWMLMTPEEIMGVETPEKIFGLPERDKNLSLEERYLKRQENAAMASASNALSGANVFSHDGANLFGQAKDRDLFSQPNSGMDPDSSKNSGFFFNAPQNSPFGQKANSIWASDFGPAQPVTKVDPEQAAAMERFRALIGERQSVGNSATPLSPMPSPSLQPAAQFDPFGHPLPNPGDELSKPASLTALTELAGSYTPPATAKKPSWKPQPAPWLSDGSTPPTTPPVRKF